MKLLSRFFLAAILLTLTSLSWGDCPKGYKSNYKGECVAIPGEAEGVVSTDPNFILKEDDQGVISGRGPSHFSHEKPHGYQVVTAPFPVRYGKYAERFEVRRGDCRVINYINPAVGRRMPDDCDTGSRRWEIMELYNRPGKGDVLTDGKVWYTFSLYFPDDFENIYPSESAHFQFKELLEGGDKDIELFIFTLQENGGFMLRVPTQVVTGIDIDKVAAKTGKACGDEAEEPHPVCFDHSVRMPIITEKDLRGKWHDFDLVVNWTPDPDKGYFKVCHNGVLAADWEGRTHLYERSSMGARAGIYQSFVHEYEQESGKEAPTTVVYLDRMQKFRGEPPEDVKACLSKVSTKVSTDLHVSISDVERESDALIRDIFAELPNFGAIKFYLDIAFWDGRTEANPNHVALVFNHHTLTSIDIPKMKQCGGDKWFTKETSMGNKTVVFPFREKRNVAPCLYNALNKSDQAIVKAVIEQIEDIIGQGVKGEADADYWKKIAKIIKDNGVNVIQ